MLWVKGIGGMSKAETGARIRAARREKGLTQEELAEKIDVCTTYLSDIDRGKSYQISQRLSRS